MERGKRIGRSFLAVLIALLLTLGVWALGYFRRNGEAIFAILTFSAGGLLIILCVVNILLLVKLKKTVEAPSVREKHDLGMRLKEEIERDYAKAEKRVERALRWGVFYFVSVAALALALCYFIGKIGDDGVGTFVSLAVLFIMLWGIFDTLTAYVPKPFPDVKYELTREECPLLHETVLRALLKANCKMNVRIFIGDGSVSICEYKKTLIVAVDENVFSLCTREELYNVMLHELAHYLHKDTAWSSRFDIILQKIDVSNNERGHTSFPKLVRILFFAYPIVKLMFLYSVTMHISSRKMEIAADQFVKEQGDAQTYIDATAKICLWRKYKGAPCREMDYELYAGEEMCRDFVQRDLSAFEAQLSNNAELWNFSLKNELPALVDSHPTLRMRMEHMNCSGYDYTRRETDESYAAEQKKQAQRMSEIFYEAYREGYAELRKKNFLSVSETIEAYDKALAEGKELSEIELVKIAETIQPADSAKAEAILDEVLRRTPDSVYAAFYKGVLLFHRGDDACVELFYKAKENPNFAETAMDYIGRFACQMGRQDLLDTYRARAVEIAQRAADQEKSWQITLKDTLLGCDMPAAHLEKDSEYILAHGKGKIVRMFCVKKPRKGQECVYAYLLDLDKNTPPQERYEIFNAVFEYLDQVPSSWDYSLLDAVSEPKLLKRFEKIQGALIYKK